MLRNKELRQFAVILAVIAAVAVTLGFFINIWAGILVLVITVAYGAAFFVFTKARYQSIARISNEINRVLHHADQLYIADSEEGELAILQSEVAKMTLRIREQNQALKQEKERLAASLADIAHQLRTPLTAVSLILTLLESSPDQKEWKALLREAEELFARMDWLLTALLKLSRLDAGIVVFQSKPVDVNALIGAALRPFLISIDLHNITLRIDVPKGVSLQGDFDWLAEAIQNILKNCLESAGDNGTLDIACEDNPLFTEITIRDSGPGFEAEDLPRLFDRFYRGKNPNVTGYGIGLALCRMIITRQGGTVTAKNHPQGGAVFALRFPK